MRTCGPRSRLEHRRRLVRLAYKKQNAEPTGVPGIRKRGPDRFHVVVTWIDRKTGRRRKREGTVGSFEAAVVLRRTLREEVEPGRPTRMRLADYAPRWLQRKRRELATSTTERYIGSLAHITERFGDYWIDAIDQGDIDGWFQGLAAGKLAPSTINGWLRVFRNLLDGAVAEGLRVGNPARSVRALREKRTSGPRGRALTAEQLGQFLTTARALGASGEIALDAARLLELIAWTGVRRGEAFGLMWEDVVQGELHIVRAASFGELKGTKTDDPRIVGIPGPLRVVLEGQRAWLQESAHPGAPSGLIFPASSRRRKRARDPQNPSDWLRSASSLTKPLTKVLGEAGLPKVTLHSLRRTYENILRQAGVDEQVRRTVAGWRSNTTQAIYAGVDSSERASAAEAFLRLVTA